MRKLSPAAKQTIKTLFGSLACLCLFLYFSMWSIQTAWLSVFCREDVACVETYSYRFFVQGAFALLFLVILIKIIYNALRPVSKAFAYTKEGDLTLSKDGAQQFRSVLNTQQRQAIENAIAKLPPDQAGIRLRGIADLQPFLISTGIVGQVAAAVLGVECRPVRAILFDKTENTNWALGWHQDRTIAVDNRAEVEGFGPWSVKEGIPHVEPPFDLLCSMVTLRVHLDAVPDGNAPLLIAPGSHKLGRIAAEDVPKVVERCGVCVCTADAGDIWLYATPILHASKAAVVPSRRRVLQVDYAAVSLPDGLQWAGI